MPPPITGPGIGGAYMGGFLPAYHASLQAANAERTRGLESGLTALKLADLLRQRQNEQDAQSAVEQLVRNVQGAGPGGAALPPTGIAAGAPAALASMAPAAGPPMPEVTPLAGPAPTVAPRPSPLQSVLRGLEPSQAARLMTGRPEVVKTFEQAERERRAAEDRSQSQESFDLGDAEFAKDTPEAVAKGLLAYKAGFTRLGQHDRAAQYMTYWLEGRRDKQEGLWQQEDFANIAKVNADFVAHPGDPSVIQRASEVLSNVKSAAGRLERMKVASNMTGKMLSPVPSIDLLYRDVAQRIVALWKTGEPVTEQAQVGAWRAAMEANPAGTGELLKQYAIGGEKAQMPDVVLRALGLSSTKPLGVKNEIEIATQQMADLYPQLRHNDPDPAIRAAYWKQHLNIQAENEHRTAMAKERPDTLLLNKAKLEMTELGIKAAKGEIPLTFAQAAALLSQVNTIISRGDFSSDAEYAQMTALVRQQAYSQLLDAARRERPAGAEAPTNEQIEALAKEQAQAAGKAWETLSPAERSRQREAAVIESEKRLRTGAAQAVVPPKPPRPQPIQPTPLSADQISSLRARGYMNVTTVEEARQLGIVFPVPGSLTPKGPARVTPTLAPTVPRTPGSAAPTRPATGTIGTPKPGLQPAPGLAEQRKGERAPAPAPVTKLPVPTPAPGIAPQGPQIETRPASTPQTTVPATQASAELRVKQIAEAIARERGLVYDNNMDKAARLEILQQAVEVYEREKQVGPPRFRGQ